MGLLPGVLAFALFFLSDWNDWKWGLRQLKVCFPIGAVLLCLTTVFQTVCAQSRPAGAAWPLFALPAAAFAVLTADALFFALPRAESYARPGEDRGTQTAGMYALCRHPGVLWFWGLYLCLWPLGLPLYAAAGYSLLNLLLAWFEDRWVFPARLKGYGEYCRSTPFLLPNPASIRACIGKH